MTRRNFKGNPPNDGRELARCEDFTLFVRDAMCKDPWVSLKMIANSTRQQKANWWIGWHKTQQRFSHVKDLDALAQYQPEVVRWLRATLEAVYPR